MDITNEGSKSGVIGLGPEAMDCEGPGEYDNAGVETSSEEGVGLPIPLNPSGDGQVPIRSKSSGSTSNPGDKGFIGRPNMFTLGKWLSCGDMAAPNSDANRSTLGFGDCVAMRVGKNAA